MLFAGYVDAAMKTALRLQEYEDLLDTETIYCIIALTSCCNRAFATCSKAFIKLEALPDVSLELLLQ
jgi:WD repeat-containing protein 35